MCLSVSFICVEVFMTSVRRRQKNILNKILGFGIFHKKTDKFYSAKEKKSLLITAQNNNS